MQAHTHLLFVLYTQWTHTSPGCSNLGRSPLTDRQEDQSEVNDVERGRGGGGVEGWGITIKWMTAYRCLGLPDNLSAASTPSGSWWYQTTALWRSQTESFSWERRNGKLKRRRKEEAGGGGWQRLRERESTSSGTSLPLLLTFGWTSRWDPPSWLRLCKARQTEGTGDRRLGRTTKFYRILQFKKGRVLKNSGWSGSLKNRVMCVCVLSSKLHH